MSAPFALGASFQTPIEHSEHCMTLALPMMVSRIKTSPLGAEMLSLPGIAAAVEALLDFDFYNTFNINTRGFGIYGDRFNNFPDPIAVVHGDVRMDNTFFKPDGSAQFVDWQVGADAVGSGCVCMALAHVRLLRETTVGGTT